MPGSSFVAGHGGQDVAARGDLDAVALQVQVGDLERLPAPPR